MKGLHLLKAFVVVSMTVVSCSEDTIITEAYLGREIDVETSADSQKLISQTVQPTDKSYLVEENGVYKTNFAGGLTFQQFLVPSNKYSFENLSPWNPEFVGISSPALLLDTRVVENKVTFVFGSAINGLVYKMDVPEYFQKLRTSSSPPPVEDYVKRAGDGGSDGLIVIAGQFAVDHSSPTGISIFDGKIPLDDSPALPTLVSDFFTKDAKNYSVSIFKSTGEVDQIFGMFDQNDPKAIKSFSANFTMVDPQHILLTGQLRTKDGTIYNLNELLLL